MVKLDMNELHRKAWAMALKYAIDRFNLPFYDKNRIIDMTDLELGRLQDMMEAFIERRDVFYMTIERFKEGFIAGYFAYEDENLHLDVKNDDAKEDEPEVGNKG